LDKIKKSSPPLQGELSDGEESVGNWYLDLDTSPITIVIEPAEGTQLFLSKKDLLEMETALTFAEELDKSQLDYLSKLLLE
jgi:hypothetical protein